MRREGEKGYGRGAAKASPDTVYSHGTTSTLPLANIAFPENENSIECTPEEPDDEFRIELPVSAN